MAKGFIVATPLNTSLAMISSLQVRMVMKWSPLNVSPPGTVERLPLVVAALPPAAADFAAARPVFFAAAPPPRPFGIFFGMAPVRSCFFGDMAALESGRECCDCDRVVIGFATKMAMDTQAAGSWPVSDGPGAQ
jgi:hypothetical protein